MQNFTHIINHFEQDAEYAKIPMAKALTANGKMLKKEHDKYRTHIYYYTDPITKKFYQ